VIRAMHGAGNRILTVPENTVRALPATDVAILSPEPIERLRRISRSGSTGCASFAGRRLSAAPAARPPVFSRESGPALEKLLQQQPHGCWILILAGKATQRWFETNRIPCVAAGSVHVGIDLPYCAQDHRVMARDAARRMLALGTAGSRCSPGARPRGGPRKRGRFLEAAGDFGGEPVDALIARHDDTTTGLCQQVRLLMSQSPRVTALFVTNAHYHLTVMGYLHGLGVRVPQDVSLIFAHGRHVFELRLAPAGALRGAARETARGLISLIEPLLAGNRCHGARC